MRRLFWVALGATVGVLVVRKLTNTARSLTPQGLAGSFSQSLSGVSEAVSDFLADMREAMSEREQELMSALTDDGTELGAKPRPSSRPR
ncbi:MAG: hypothetical protein ABR604_08465 [Jatrophihabitantaceae bacterium]